MISEICFWRMSAAKLHFANLPEICNKSPEDLIGRVGKSPWLSWSPFLAGSGAGRGPPAGLAVLVGLRGCQGGAGAWPSALTGPSQGRGWLDSPSLMSLSRGLGLAGLELAGLSWLV